MDPTLKRLGRLRTRRKVALGRMDEEIAEAVRASRGELSMETMAKRLGLSRQALYNLLARTPAP